MHRDIIFPAMQIIFLSEVYFRKLTILTQSMAPCSPPLPPPSQGGKEHDALAKVAPRRGGVGPHCRRWFRTRPLYPSHSQRGATTARIVPRHLSAWDSLWPLILLLLFTFLLRAFYADQPIVENYVGRQVPTAMVARNLDRGKGLLRPQLDTAPFPNYFLVEPPIYESGVVVLKRATGLSLEEAGRVLSALATTLAALGLFRAGTPRVKARSRRTLPSPPSRSFRSRSAMGVPSSPTPP